MIRKEIFLLIKIKAALALMMTHQAAFRRQSANHWKQC
jgi:hypothetical protein